VEIKARIYSTYEKGSETFHYAKDITAEEINQFFAEKTKTALEDIIENMDKEVLSKIDRIAQK